MQDSFEYTASLSPSGNLYTNTLRIMERAATKHTELLGLDRSALLDAYEAVWMIVRCSLHYEALPDAALPLTVHTRHLGVIRGLVYRDYQLLQNGLVIGHAIQTWVLVHWEKRTLIRMERLPLLCEAPHAQQSDLPIPKKLIPPHALAEIDPVLPHADVIDVNGHVNNAAYPELAFSGLTEKLPSFHHLELNYLHECFAQCPLPRLLYHGTAEAFVRLLTPEGVPAFDLFAY